MVFHILRASALLTRILSPILLLSLSGSHVMGQYYLFVSYFGFASGISGLECSIPFAQQLLKYKSLQARKIIFSRFFFILLLIALLTSSCFGAILGRSLQLSGILTGLFCLSVFTETCVNELGRLYWNIGEWQHLSLRDFYRSLFFLASVVIPVHFGANFPSIFFFLLLSLSNLFLLAAEFNKFGSYFTASNLMRKSDSLIKILTSMLPVLNRSMPQFFQIQILSFVPLLERIFLERYAGLVAVASFSLFNTFIQSAAGLQLVPSIARNRSIILSSTCNKTASSSSSKSLLQIFNICRVCAIWACVGYILLPFLVVYLRKSLELTPSIAIVATISALSSISSSAISPYFVMNRLSRAINSLSIIALLVLIVPVYGPAFSGYFLYPLQIICFAALLQLLVRVALLPKQRNIILTQ